MADPELREDPDQGLLDGIEGDDGDGRGIGSTLAPDVRVEAERREIERGVYERRSFADREADERPDTRPPDPALADGRAKADPTTKVVAAGPAGDNEQQGARLAHAKAQEGDETSGPDPAREQGRMGSINDTDGA